MRRASSAEQLDELPGAMAVEDPTEAPRVADEIRVQWHTVEQLDDIPVPAIVEKLFASDANLKISFHQPVVIEGTLLLDSTGPRASLDTTSEDLDQLK